ncbi:DUF5597 domain-containing protein [Sinomicrobium sp. M5D2P9]
MYNCPESRRVLPSGYCTSQGIRQRSFITAANVIALKVPLFDLAIVVKHDHTLGWSAGAEEEVWPDSGVLLIETAPGKLTVAGTGIVITFFSDDKKAPKAGIARIDEGKYENGEWKPGRRMNGDQSHQGRHLRIPVGRYGIQKVELYTYK